MWDDAKRLNAIASALSLVALALLLCGGIAWPVPPPTFAIREVVFRGKLERGNPAHLEAVARSELAGTFFTMNLEQSQAALAEVPWVRSVALRRQWPQRLEATIDEHIPLARWNDAALVDVTGDV